MFYSKRNPNNGNFTSQSVKPRAVWIMDSLESSIKYVQKFIITKIDLLDKNEAACYGLIGDICHLLYFPIWS